MKRTKKASMRKANSAYEWAKRQIRLATNRELAERDKRKG